MDIKFEGLIRLLFDAENISPYDGLSDEINSFCDDELTQEDLELVSAAGKSDHEKLVSLYLNNDKRKYKN